MSARTLLLSIVLLCMVGSEGFAQTPWLRFDPLFWEASADFDGRWRDEDSGRRSDRQTDLGLRVKTTGYSFDPRILRYHIDLQPVYSFGKRTDPRTENDDIDGNRIRYDLRMTALQGARSPLWFDAGTARNDGNLDRGFGGRYDFDLETRNAAAHWKSQAFPSTLSYDERRRDIEFTSGTTDTGSETNDVLRTVAYHGRSRKLDVRLEHADLDDRRPQDNDYDVDRARARHRFRWGRGSELTSLFNYRDRSGFLPDQERRWQQDARVRHTRRLLSNTGYTLRYTERGDTDVDLTEGRFALTHKLYENLSSTGRVKALRRDANIGTEDQYEGGARLDYRKGIGWGGNLAMGLGGLYRVQDRDLDEGAEFATTQEEQQVPSVGLPVVQLDQPFVDEDSIIVQNAARDITYTEGKEDDYEVDTIGDFTQLTIVSGGDIQPGQVLFIQYSFEVRSQKFSTTELDFNGNLSFSWITFFFNYFSSTQSLISGQDGDFLLDRRNAAVGFRADWRLRKAQLKLSAERRYNESNDLERISYVLIQGLTYRFTPRTSLNLRLSQAFSDSDDTSGPNDLKQTLYNGEAYFDLRPRPRMTIRPRVAGWYRDDSRPEEFGGDRENHFWTAGVDLRWKYRKFETALRYAHNRWGGDSRDVDEDRLQLELIRRSR